MAGQGGTTGLLTGAVTDATINAASGAASGRGLVLEQTGGAGGNGPNAGNSADNQWSNVDTGGRIVPQVSTVLPDVYVPVMIIDGAVTGAIQGSQSTLFAYDTHDPPTEITLSARSTGFAPAGFGISGAAAEVAAYLQPVFDTATTPELGAFFASLGALADAGPARYIDALRQLSPGSTLAFASRARRDHGVRRYDAAL